MSEKMTRIEIPQEAIDAAITQFLKDLEGKLSAPLDFKSILQAAYSHLIKESLKFRNLGLEHEIVSLLSLQLDTMGIPNSWHDAECTLEDFKQRIIEANKKKVWHKVDDNKPQDAFGLALLINRRSVKLIFNGFKMPSNDSEIHKKVYPFISVGEMSFFIEASKSEIQEGDIVTHWAYASDILPQGEDL